MTCLAENGLPLTREKVLEFASEAGIPETLIAKLVTREMMIDYCKANGYSRRSLRLLGFRRPENPDIIQSK